MKINWQSGVALIQVLFIAAILSLMALHFTLTSRQQVLLANTLQDKIIAELKLNDWQNTLIFTLLTQTTTDLLADESSKNAIVQAWNFYGKVFSPSQNVEMSIQDAYGLISLAMPGRQEELGALLRTLMLNANDIANLKTALANRQAFESHIYQGQRAVTDHKSLPMQSITELKQLPGISQQHYEQLKKVVTILPVSFFNPLTSPDLRLKSLLPIEAAAKVIELRNNGQLDSTTYLAITGSNDYEQMAFTPGQLLILDISVSHGAAVAKRRFICYIRPENQFPVIWLD